MERLLSLYQKLRESGTRFYMWSLQGDKAVTMEVDGSYGIFIDFDNVASSSSVMVSSFSHPVRKLSLLRMKADTPLQEPHIRCVVLSTW